MTLIRWTPEDMKVVQRMLDDGWGVELFLNELGTYTAAGSPSDVDQPIEDALEKSLLVTDHTPGGALTRPAKGLVDGEWEDENFGCDEDTISLKYMRKGWLSDD